MSNGGDTQHPDGWGPPAPQAQRPAERGRRGPGWIAIVVTAILAAALAAGATALVMDAAEAPPAPAPTATSEPAAPGQGSSPDWTAVSADVRDSVVAIDVRTPRGEAAGSGVIIDEAGSIVTNAHVLGNVEQGALVIITFADGRMFEASVVGSDPTTDIAVVRLDEPPEDIRPATLGSAAALEVGDPVLAVGNPLGLDSTATTGIVSALDRPVVTRGTGSDDAVVTNAIQVDAAINPGNSGGPLFDARGDVIGINSSIATLSGGAEGGSIGLGFAIPIEQAQLVADQLIETGRVEHAFLGVALSNAVVSVEGETRQGAQVERVEPDSPAAAAELTAGDVVVAIDGRRVDGAASLTGYVRQYAAGAEVTLDVVQDGESRSVTVELAVRETAPN